MKFRLAYTKLGKVRFLGHRDVARLWERTLRKAEIPVAMSTGFTPRSRISFGLALPTGAESLIELLDITVDRVQGRAVSEAPDLGKWRERIDEALPSGFAVTYVGEVAAGDVSLQESVTASSWILLIDHPDVERAVDALRASESALLERERKGEMQCDDIRPGILEIGIARAEHLDSVVDVWPGDPLRSGSATAISAVLTTSGRGIRPTELVQALIPGDEPWDHLTRVLRTQQWIEKDGQRIDVLSDSVARPQVCA
jgi:radical SAM-linked protein